MAFTFNSINSQLDGNQKQNIFDPNAGKANPQFGGGQANDVFQTSGSGGGAGAGAASSGSGQARAAPKQANAAAVSNPGQASKAYAGLGSVNTGNETAKIGENISNANAKLQSEADAYRGKVSNQAAGYSIDPNQLEKAASGDDASLRATSARLAKTQADPFEGFAGLKNEDLANGADVLQKGDYGEIFRPTASANYTQGQSRLQGMLLGRDAGFKADANKLVADQAKSIKANDQMKIDETKAANEQLGKAYSTATQDARNVLGGMSDQVMNEAAGKAALEQAAREGLDPTKLSQEEFKKLAEQMKLELAGDKTSTLGRSAGLLDDPSKFDLSKYLTVDKGVNASEMLDQAGVDRFNRINGLLGNGKLATLDADGAGPQYSFNSQGAKDALKAQLLGQQQTSDQDVQSKLDAIKAAATGRASADQGDALQNAKDYITRKYLDQNEGQTPEQMQREQEVFRQLFNPETNWNPYYTEQGGLTKAGSTPRQWSDLLTPQEAQQMNEYTAKLGTPQQFAAGSQYNTSNYNPEYFDQLFNKNFSRISGEIDGTVPMTSNQGTASNSELGQGLGRDRTVNPIVDAQKAAEAEAAAQAYAKSLPNRLLRR